MQSWIFASLLQSSVSHDPSEIILIYWFASQQTLLIYNVEKSCAASYFYGNHDTCFSGFFDEQKVQKIYFKYNIL